MKNRKTLKLKYQFGLNYLIQTVFMNDLWNKI